MSKKTVVLEFDPEDFSVIRTYTKEKKDKIVQSKLSKMDNYSDEAKSVLNLLEMSRKFYEIKGPAYYKARDILEAYIPYSYPISTAGHFAGGYNPNTTAHNQFIREETPLDIISMGDDLYLNPDYTRKDAIEAVIDVCGISQKANNIVSMYHLDLQCANYQAVKMIVDEIIENISKTDKKLSDILDFSYRNPDTVHMLVTEKALAYQEKTGQTERTFRNNLPAAIKRFAMELWGPIPDLSRKDIFEIIGGEIQFVENKKR